MNSFPRSPAVLDLIERAQSVAHVAALYAPVNDDAGPTPYLTDDRRGARMVEELHTAPGFNLGGLIAGLILYGFAAIGVLALAWGALDFALWGLELVGRPA